MAFGLLLPLGGWIIGPMCCATSMVAKGGTQTALVAMTMKDRDVELAIAGHHQSVVSGCLLFWGST